MATGGGAHAAKASDLAPTPHDSLVGREQELEQLLGLAGPGRLLTITGAPGVGKSRLASELARQRGGDYSGETCHLQLASLTSSRALPAALADALSVKRGSHRSLTEALAAHLAKRELLLILDNCEHVAKGCGKLVDCLLTRCPAVAVVATSREPLVAADEQVWRVSPLAVPLSGESHDPEVLERFEAVHLFLERARAVQPGFSLNSYVAPQIASIVARTEGIPLAIELAALRVDTLTTAEIARRIEDRFALLTNGAGHSSRHESLRETLDLSHELLSDEERMLLRRLSVFAGRLDAPGASAVAPDEELEAESVPELLRSLQAKSLLEPEPGGAGDSYSMLETVRAYAAERLEEAGEQSQFREAHAAYYLALAEQAEPHLSGAAQHSWFGRLEAEHANLRAAAEWSLSRGKGEWALRLAGALALFWSAGEGEQLLEGALSAGGEQPPALRTKALWALGFTTLIRDDYARALPALEESLTGFEQLGDRRGYARALMLIGKCRQDHGDATAASLFEQSAATAREVDDPWCLCRSLGYRANAYFASGELAEARRFSEQCVDVATDVRDMRSLRWALINLSATAIRQGDFHGAQAALERALEIMGEFRLDALTPLARTRLGQLASLRGDNQGARKLLDEALEQFRDLGTPAMRILALTARAHAALAEDDVETARELLGEAAALARGWEGPAARMVFHGLAELAVRENDLAAARTLLEKVLDLARAGGDAWWLARALHGLGKSSMSSGETKRAAALHREALELSRAMGDAAGLTDSLEAIALLTSAGGQEAEAARMLGAAEAQRERSGHARSPSEQDEYNHLVAGLCERLGAAAFEAALVAGRRLTVEQAAAEVCEGRRRPTSGWSSLTKREREVAFLAAEGLTNPEIAQRLVISLGTVKGHLSHLFCKLGIEKRSDLIREALRHQQSA